MTVSVLLEGHLIEGPRVGPNSNSFPEHSSMGCHVNAYKAHLPPGLLNHPSLVLTISRLSNSSSKQRFRVFFERQPRDFKTEKAADKSPLL